MQRFVRSIVLLVTGCISVVIIGVLLALFFFEPNDFRDRVTSIAKKQIGRELVLGDIDLKLFPWIAIEIGRTELGNPEGFSEGVFLSFEEASFSVKLIPLVLRQEIQAGKITLNGVEVNLEVASDGMDNWHDLISKEVEQDSVDPVIADFDVGKVVLINAAISYSDMSAGAFYEVANLSVETGRIAANTPFGVTGQFDVSSGADGINGHLRVDSEVTIEPATLILEGSNISGSILGVLVDPIAFEFDSRKVAVDLAAEQVSLGDMDLNLLGVTIAATFEPFSYADLHGPKVGISIDDFSVIELMGKVAGPTLELSDSSALQHVSISANVLLSEKHIQLSTMSVNIDDSHITGDMELPLTPTGQVLFDFQADAISMDRYLVFAGDGFAKSDSASDIEIPTALIHKLSVDGRLGIKEIAVAGLEASNIEVTVNSSHGRLRIATLVTGFYDGRYTGDLTIDVSKELPVLSASQHIENANVGALLLALADIDDISGTAKASAAVLGSGHTLPEIIDDLAGQVSFELVDGVWEGTDIWYQLRAARSLFRQEVPPKPTLPVRTPFLSVEATGSIDKGVFANNDFSAVLPFLELSGGGEVDLTTTEIDYSLEVNVVERSDLLAGDWADVLADFQDTVVPVKITGSLESPEIRPDIEQIFRARVEESVEETKEKLRDRVLKQLLGDGEEEDGGEESVKKLGKDLLKKLFNN